MLSGAKAELRQHPERERRVQDRLPPEAPRQQNQNGRHRQKNNVQRENVKKRRAVNQQRRFRDGLLWSRYEIEIEQIVEPRAVAARRNRHSHEESKSQQKRVVAI